MGEIATWSAVKTKVGLGKDSNECPTKAELLALSPTGTGENYVGLEISNASSYGNNETVKLEDIHKITYKYVFTVEHPTLSFTALGGVPTPSSANVASTREKILDGVATGTIERVSYNYPALPDWLTLTADLGYRASENTTLSARTFTHTLTQQDSGKQLTITCNQVAATQTFEYVFKTQYPGIDFNALGKVSSANNILGFTSTRQEYRNGTAYGDKVTIEYTSSEQPSWINHVTGGDWSAQENKSTNSRTGTNTYTQTESGKKITATFTQAAGVKTYGTPTVYLGTIADIPASGGTAATPTYTYTQLWGWNGKTNDGGTINSGASVVWSENISGSNLGTTAKARTKLGSRTLTVTLNGKSGNASIDIYQAENKITNVTQGTWVVSISANPSTFTEQGGTSQISASARASRTNHWSSGATNAASDATGTPTLSIPTAVTGFSLSGTTLTVAENKTANQRSVVVRATMDTVYKEVTVTQSAYLVEWEYTFTATPTTLNFDALGTAKSITITSYREKYINGSIVSGSRENVDYIHATSTEHIGKVLDTSISMQENETTSSRTGQVSYEQNGSDKVIRITCNQAAGTVSTRSVLEVVDNFGDSPAVGGSIFGIVKSGYYDVINGKDSTWHNVTPTLKSKSSYITNVEITKASGDGYNIGITLSENTSESSRRASLTLTYGSKELDMATTQAGASVAWSYELKVNNGTQDLNQQVPAKPSGTYSFTISSKRYKIVNGSVTSQSEDTTWTTSIPGSPSWIHVEEQSNTLIVTVDENTTTSQRSADIVIFQTGSSDTSITLTVEQQAASITWNYTFNIFQPSSKVLNVPAKMIDPDTIVVNSYRTKVINGTQTSTKEFVEVTIDPIEESWLEVTKNSNDQTQAELFVTCLENKVSSIRSATVTIRQVGTSNLDQVDINQSAATVSYNYYIGFNGNPDVGGYSMNWECTQFGSSHGQSIDLKCWRKPVINGIESDTEEAAEYEVIFSGVGIDSFIVTNTPLSYDPTITTVRAYPKSINGSVFDLKGTVQYRIADYPSKSAYLYLTHKPVSTVKRWTFQWYDQVESVTIKNVSHDSSAGSISPITIISKCEYLLASNQSQVAYTEYIKPNEDEDTATPVSWGRLVENGQTAQNYYDYAYLVDENKEDYDRQATRTFTQPGNPSNKRLYLYITQESKEAWISGNISNGGTRELRLNTIIDNNFKGNIQVLSGGSYGLGELGKGASNIELNVGIYRTDSSAYTQIVDFDHATFGGKKISLDTYYADSEYEWTWTLYPSAGVPSGFGVNVSLLSSDGDIMDGIRFTVTKKNGSMFPVGTLIGTLELTPRDSSSKLPTIVITISHGYFV